VVLFKLFQRARSVLTDIFGLTTVLRMKVPPIYKSPRQCEQCGFSTSAVKTWAQHTRECSLVKMRVYGEDSIPAMEAVEEVTVAEVRDLRLLVERQGKQLLDQQELLNKLFELVAPKNEVVLEDALLPEQDRRTTEAILLGVS